VAEILEDNPRRERTTSKQVSYVTIYRSLQLLLLLFILDKLRETDEQVHDIMVDKAKLCTQLMNVPVDVYGHSHKVIHSSLSLSLSLQSIRFYILFILFSFINRFSWQLLYF